MSRDKARSLSVHLAPIADFHHQDAQGAIRNAVDDVAVAHAVLLKFAQLTSLEGLTNAARIIEHRHAAVQERQDTPGVLGVELAQFAHSSKVKLNPSNQTAS